MRRLCMVRLSGFAEEKKFTFLSGEICASRDRRFKSLLPERSTRLIKDPAYLVTVDGYESLQRETRNRQQLMSNLIAPFMETYLVSTQKSAEGIVVVGAGSPCPYDEGPNAEKSEAIS